MIDVLEEFLDKIRAFWVKNEAQLGNINGLKGFGAEKGCLGWK